MRGLPHVRLATLRGVQRWGGRAWLVWTWLDGETWNDCVEKPLDDFPALASRLVDAVALLHELGIIHGSLHGTNVIVRSNRQVWLTHVSPYLYTEPAGDISLLIGLLSPMIDRLDRPIAARLQTALDQLARGETGLRELSHALRKLNDEQPVADEPTVTRRYRVSSVLWAAGVAIAGLVLAAGIYERYPTQSRGHATTYPSLKPNAR